MSGKTEKASNIDQTALCIRWPDDDLTAHEDFISLHQLPMTDARDITNEFACYDPLLECYDLQW